MEDESMYAVCDPCFWIIVPHYSTVGYDFIYASLDELSSGHS